MSKSIAQEKGIEGYPEYINFLNILKAQPCKLKKH